MNNPQGIRQLPDRDQAVDLLSRWSRDQQIPQESPDWQSCSGFVREMVWSSLRHRAELDAWIDHLSRQPPGKRIRPLLWVGMTQLLLLDGIPDHAAVHETMETAKRRRIPQGQQRFIHALLRNTLREKEKYPNWRSTKIPEIRYSHPGWLIRRWEKTFGEKTTAAICTWNQQRAHTYARLTAIGFRNHIGESLPEDVRDFPLDPRFYQLPRKYNPVDLPEFRKGAWYVQDPATRLAPDLMDAQPGEHILDGCAAPGGKTGMLADAMGEDPSGLMAMDPQQTRINRLEENLHRLGHLSVELRTGEPRDLLNSHAEAFDGVLLDVPCSNTGVLQRRPDAKWNLEPGGFEERATLQSRILSDSAPLVAPGGRIVYSTCCIEPEETTELIASWLKAHPDWTSVQDHLVLPGEQNTDGAYVCRLERRS